MKKGIGLRDFLFHKLVEIIFGKKCDSPLDDGKTYNKERLVVDSLQISPQPPKALSGLVLEVFPLMHCYLEYKLEAHCKLQYKMCQVSVVIREALQQPKINSWVLQSLQYKLC